MGARSRDTDSEVLAAVAAELRAEAARQAMSLRDLADRAGLPYPTVQKSLSAMHMIDVNELALLCEALGITPAELMERATPAVLPRQRRSRGRARSRAAVSG